MRRRAVTAGLVVVGLYVLAGILVPWLAHVDHLRTEVESRLSGALRRPVRLGPLAISVWTGPALHAETMEIAEVTPVTSETDRVAVTASDLTVRPSLVSILRGRLEPRAAAFSRGTVLVDHRPVIEQIAVDGRVRRGEDGSVEFVGRAHGRWAALWPSASIGGRVNAVVSAHRVEIRSLALEAGGVEIAADGEITRPGGEHLRLVLQGRAGFGQTTADGSLTAESGPQGPRGTFRLASAFADFDEIAGALVGARSGAAGSKAFSTGIVPVAAAAETTPASGQDLLGDVRLAGTWEAKRGRAAGLELENLSCRVSLVGGNLRVDRASFALYGGRHRGEIDLAIKAPGRPFHVRSRIEGVDVHRLLAAVDTGKGGAVHGTGVIDLDVNGHIKPQGSDRSLDGKARVEIRDGRLASVGLLQQVAEVLEMAGGRGIGKKETPFDHVSATFAIRGREAVTEDLEFRSPDLDLDGGGRVGLDGRLELDVDAAFSRSASADFTRNTPQLRFLVGPGGRLTLPLRIRGALSQPVVQVDLDRVLREGLERKLGFRDQTGLRRRLLGED
jgi:hypothetical protein